MSINMDTTDVVDYSDFRFQQVQSAVNKIGSISDYNVTGLNSVEPLEGGGQLANNEVAELVASKIITYIEFEPEAEDHGDDSFAEARGVFGANLPASADALISDGPNVSDGQFAQITDGSESDFEIRSRSQVEDRIFDHFANVALPQYEAAGTGTGGGGATNVYESMMNYRSLYGRGPVLDQTDDVTILHKLQGDPYPPGVSHQVRAHLVWDVAEVDDAGRAFSLPS